MLTRRTMLSAAVVAPALALPATAADTGKLLNVINLDRATDLIETHRRLADEVVEAQTEMFRIRDLMPKPTVVLTRERDGTPVTYAEREFHVHQRYDALPIEIFPHREEWREAKLEELRQWEAHRDAEDQRLGSSAAWERFNDLCDLEAEAFKAICDHTPRTFAEAALIAAHVSAYLREHDDREATEWMAVDLLEA